MKRLIAVAVMAVGLAGMFSEVAEAAQRRKVVVRQQTQVRKTGKNTYKATTKQTVTGQNGKQKKSTVNSTITTR